MQLAFPVKTEGPIPSASPARVAMRMIRQRLAPAGRHVQPRKQPLFCLSQPEKTDNFSVLLFTTPSRTGKWNSVIRVNNEPEITLWQFIYP